MSEWLSALTDVLLENFSPEPRFEQLPSSMIEWKRGITVADNPYATWLDEHVIVTGNKEDVVLMADIAKHVGEVQDGLKMVKAYFAGVKGVSFVAKTTVTVDGKQSYPRNLFRGSSAHVRNADGGGLGVRGDALRHRPLLVAFCVLGAKTVTWCHRAKGS
jgi:hypothetical protein